MELVHRFTLPLGVEEAWAHFNDIGAVAECFPGATVASADEEGFTGSVKVKLGPIALLYNGSGTFVEKDPAAHRMVIEAKGKDKRGNGTAGADVVLEMTGVDAGTEVVVTTELAITGKPAQFGRGVMQDVSDKLLGQFVACLEERHRSSAPAPTPPDEPSPAPPQQPAPAPQAPGAETPPEPAPPPRPAPPASGTAGSTDALDLGGAALPVLARTYGPWLAGAAAVLVLVLRFRRRRRRRPR